MGMGFFGGGRDEGYGDFLKWIVVMVAQLQNAILGDPLPSSNPCPGSFQIMALPSRSVLSNRNTV